MLCLSLYISKIFVLSKKKKMIRCIITAISSNVCCNIQFLPCWLESSNGQRMCVHALVRACVCVCVYGMSLKCALRWPIHTHQCTHTHYGTHTHTPVYTHILVPPPPPTHTHSHISAPPPPPHTHTHARATI